MPLSICTACGTQYSDSPQHPAQCVICEEERQYVPPRGQTWTTLEALSKSHMNGFHEYDTGIIGIGSGGTYALSAARALVQNTKLGVSEVVKKALLIASEIDVYTNANIIVEEMKCSK